MLAGNNNITDLINKSIYTIFFLVLLSGCEESIIRNTENQTLLSSKEVTLTFEETVTDEIAYHLVQATSLSETVALEKGTIRIPSGNFTELVFALNENQQPLFANLESGKDAIALGPHNTALALSYLFIAPVSELNMQEVEELISHENTFKSLTKHIHSLAAGNQSFINDAKVHTLLNELFVAVANDISRLKEQRSFKTPDIEIERTGEHTIRLTNNSYIPYNVTGENVSGEYIFTDEIIGERIFSTLNGGNNTKISKTIDIEQGVLQFSIGSTKKTEELKAKRMTQDLLAVFFESAGISSKKDLMRENIAALSTRLLDDPAIFSTAAFNKMFSAVQAKYTSKKTMVSDFVIRRFEEEGVNNYEASLITKNLLTFFLNLDIHPLLFATDYFYQDWEGIGNKNLDTIICTDNQNSRKCNAGLTSLAYEVLDERCTAYDHKMKFNTNFVAPQGLAAGTRAKVTWSFNPSGNAGFWVSDIQNSDTQLAGTIQIAGCFSFGTQEELHVNVSLIDQNNSYSNEISVVVPRPEGFAAKSTKLISSAAKSGNVVIK